MANPIQVISRSLIETQKFAKQMAELSAPGQVWALCGDLGSGKTTLLRMMGEALGVKTEIQSPSFVLEHIYQAKFPIYHYDFYRIQSLLQLEQLGFYENIPSESSLAWIEWADLYPQILPQHFHLLKCRILDQDTREYQYSFV